MLKPSLDKSRCQAFCVLGHFGPCSEIFGLKPSFDLNGGSHFARAFLCTTRKQLFHLASECENSFVSKHFVVAIRIAFQKRFIKGPLKYSVFNLRSANSLQIFLKSFRYTRNSVCIILGKLRARYSSERAKYHFCFLVILALFERMQGHGSLA